MGLSIVKDTEQNEAVLVNTSIGKPFGLVMDADIVDDFVESLYEDGLDPRYVEDNYLSTLYYNYIEKLGRI